ncbi:MAG: DUF2125 domain-containing protein [Pseudomonadota bacterium]
MRVLSAMIGTALIVAAGWSAWWYAGAEGQRTGMELWLEDRRQGGWQADAAAIDVTGYPFDFRSRVTDLALADPANGWSWRAPLLTAESAAIEPTRIALTWPRKQVFATTQDTANIKAAEFISHVDLRPGLSMELREIGGEVRNLDIEGRSGWRARAGEIRLDVTEKPVDLAPPNSYDARAIAAQVELPKVLVERLDPTGWLTPSVDRITITGHAAFDAPIDRHMVEQGTLGLRAATIRQAGFEWGDMRLDLRGAFTVDDDGYPDGEIVIKAREWRQMVRIARLSGMIGRDLEDIITSAVEFVSVLSGGGDDLEFPLALGGGALSIGPFAIADVPRLAPPR